MAEYLEISIGLIDEPPLPVRNRIDTQRLEELAEDIKLNGVIEPLIVSEHDGRYRIWAGHRRFLAARMAYLQTLPCIVRWEHELPAEAVMLSENLCREDLTPAEVGWFVLRLVNEHHVPLEDLCRRLRRSEQWIQERVDLVQADELVATAVAERKIPFSVAKELNKCSNEEHRRYLLGLAIQHGCTARTVNYQVDQWRQQQQVPIQPAPGAAEPVAGAPAVDLNPQCPFCGLKDAPQNMKQIYVHYYHWDPIKAHLREEGFKVCD